MDPIEFMPVTLQDRQTIEQYTVQFAPRDCEFSFGNLFCWQEIQDTHFAVYKDSLLLRFTIQGKHIYTFPIGKQIDQSLCNEILSLLPDAIFQAEESVLKQYCDEKFHITPHRDFFDYIYLRENLATLKGSKYQQKRNHINKFKSQYQYEYIPLNSTLTEKCIALEKEWRLQHNQGEQTSYNAEEDAISRALSHFNELQLIGGAIVINNTIEAFTIGCPINDNTFNVMFEKANSSFDGIYSIINQEFAQRIPEKYIYINREEDLGKEGLRKSKLSYKPYAFIEKSTAYKATKRTDSEQLWKHCFGDSDEFIQFYFNTKYQEKNTFTKYDNKNIISVLQAIPYTISINGSTYSAAYISGACTHPEYRNQHCMSELLTETISELKKRNIAIVFLIPQEQWLYDFYAKFGFKPLLTNHIEEINKPNKSQDFSVISNKQNNLPKELLYSIYKKVSIKNNCINHTKQDFYDCIDEVYVSHGTILSITENQQIVAFAIANEQKLEIFADETYNESFIYAYCNLYDKQTATVLTQKKGNTSHGMICILNTEIQIKTPIFANLLME
ncbi:MAG: GNAT family N-acetyltransferase [Bacteroidales bacterium]|nr:GNAT family N-acetyltransferase [Bacteroidales bacterium]